MQMISLVFFGFVVLVLLVLALIGKIVKKDETCVSVSNWALLIASYIFCIYADWRFAAVLALMTLVTWGCAKAKKYYRIGIAVAIAALAFFKYTNFFAESFARLLGRGYTMTGRVTEGKQLGRTMGYPTANISIPKHKALPAFGVYA